MGSSHEFAGFPGGSLMDPRYPVPRYLYSRGLSVQGPPQGCCVTPRYPITTTPCLASVVFPTAYLQCSFLAFSYLPFSRPIYLPRISLSPSPPVHLFPLPPPQPPLYIFFSLPTTPLFPPFSDIPSIRPHPFSPISHPHPSSQSPLCPHQHLVWTHAVSGNCSGMRRSLPPLPATVNDEWWILSSTLLNGSHGSNMQAKQIVMIILPF